MLKKTVQLFVFRHGQTAWNAEGRIQGHLDVPLNDQGRSQARALVSPLGRLDVQAILSSDLSRAHETATIIAEPLGIPVFTDAGLREIFFGQAQGMNRAEIERKFGVDFSHRLRTTPLSEAEILALGCESGAEVIARSAAAIVGFLERQGFDRIGVATHGGVIRRLIQHAAGTEEFPPPIPNGVLFPLSFDPGRGIWNLSPTMPVGRAP